MTKEELNIFLAMAGVWTVHTDIRLEGAAQEEVGNMFNPTDTCKSHLDSSSDSTEIEH